MLPATISSSSRTLPIMSPEEEPAEGEWYSRAVVPMKPASSRKTVFLSASVALASLLLSAGAAAVACKEKKLQIESICVAGVLLLVAFGAAYRVFRAVVSNPEKQPLL